MYKQAGLKMQDLESSFELLSTMSPRPKKIHTTGKKLRKSPHKLSLKSNVRKSAGFDQKFGVKNQSNDLVIVLDETVIGGKTSPKIVKIVSSPIVISSSSGSAETPDSSGTEQSGGGSQTGSRFRDTEKWLSDNEKLEGNPEVFSFRNQSFSDTDEEFHLRKDSLTTSTEFLTNCNSLRLNIAKGSSISTRPSSSQEVSTDSKQGFKMPVVSPERTPTFGEKQLSFCESSSDNDVVDDSTENILDELYGKSWRKNRDQVLMKSEPRPQKKKQISYRGFMTERKPKAPAKPIQPDTKPWWVSRLKDLCDSDTSDDSINANSFTSPDDLSDTYKKVSSNTSSSDDDNEPCFQTPRTTQKTTLIGAKKKPNNFHSKPEPSNTNSESDNDSLETRIRKKLAKKAQEPGSISKEEKVEKSVDKNLEKNSQIGNVKNTPGWKTPRNKPVIKTPTARKLNPSSRVSSSDKLSSDNSGKSSDAEPKKQAKGDTKEIKCSFLRSLSAGIPRSECDFSAYFFKSNYATQKEALAKKLFELYNKKIFNNVLPSDTPLQWNVRMRGSAGFCYNRRVTRTNGTVTRSSRIVLATKILDNADRLRDTLVHEMCHAAVWMVNNVSGGHGPYWKSWAHKAMATFPELPPIKRCHDYVINTKYTYKCTTCGYSFGRHSKSLDMDRKRCGYCYGKFELFLNKTSKSGEKQRIPASEKSKPTGFALFVKENYGTAKRDNLTHGEVMKTLGQKFSALKVAQ